MAPGVVLLDDNGDYWHTAYPPGGGPLRWYAPEQVPTLADFVNHPPHYGGNPEGIECIQVTRHMNFNRGNAVKYIWRADAKGNEVEDLRKARWYITDELRRLGVGDDEL